ncbi:inovirus Gp2 family protein [Burkholderia pseudomallei]|uniref:inovirus Gp2 family protein n=1 Tax=Burkholderia pseudomallei TaxID=28450 RepID=UPI0021F7DEBF|nr:inovirus Gp2 family protein [Burkholderia pseudomallei]MCW0168370.1 inovirus Gp2 family protein [Burkholderia pseudomallei]
MSDKSQTIEVARSVADIETWLLDFAINSMKKSDKRRPHYGPDTRAEDAAMITVCVRDVIDSNETLFGVVRKNGIAFDSPRQLKLVPTQLGTKFLHCLDIDIEYLSMGEPIDEANPFVDLFKRAVGRNHVDDVAEGLQLSPARYELRFLSSMRRGLFDDEVSAFAFALNDVVADIRAQGRAKPFLDELKPHLKRATKNYRSIVKLFRALFEKHRRLLIIRVDFEYMREHRSIPYAEVRKHANALVRYLKRIRHRNREVFKAYVLKLEYALRRGWHFHGLVALDGHIVHGDVYYGKKLGEHWKNVTTKGKGGYYNCNGKPRKYGKTLGVGMVERDDPDRRPALETIVAGYLAKPDFYAPMMKADGDRLLFKSELPNIPPVKRGRRRLRVDQINVLLDPTDAKRGCENGRRFTASAET